jgi:hypothetical protein
VLREDEALEVDVALRAAAVIVRKHHADRREVVLHDGDVVASCRVQALVCDVLEVATVPRHVS